MTRMDLYHHLPPEVSRMVFDRLDLIIRNTETIMTKADDAKAAMDALEAKITERDQAHAELGAAILHEIDQLKAAGTGGTGDGMSATDVDALIVRMEAARAKTEAGTGADRASADALKADD